MHVLGVVGPSDTGKTSLVERLLDRLPDGEVATVKHCKEAPTIDTDGTDTDRHRTAGAAVSYGISANHWFATGTERTLDETLDELAPRYEYAILEGYSDASVPQVVLGDDDPVGDIVARGADASAIDVDAVVERLHDTEPYVTLGSLVAAAKRSDDADRSGAIATFTGRVRKLDGEDDEPTEYLEFEKYKGVAEQRLEALIEDLEAREGVYRVLAHHRTGIVEAGEDIVFVVVLAGHRTEAFQTVEDGINRLKDEVPLFKKEVTVDDEFWRHERPVE